MANSNSSLSTVQKAQLRQAVRSLQIQSSQLNGAFFERSNEILLLQLALISGQPLVLLGEAGVAKTELVQAFAETIEVEASFDGVSFWEYLLGKYTTPSELMGTASLKRLREDDVYMINPKGKLPTARVAFLDECFKANSATLNSLLKALNEAKYDDGSGVAKDMELELAVGASNEMPEEGVGLEPLWDRFVLRQWVAGDIESESNFVKLLQGDREEITCEVPRAHIQLLKELRDSVSIDGIIQDLCDLRTKMKELAIRVSPRRWVKIVKVVKSMAILKGRLEARRSDMTCLFAVLWDSPDQIPAIGELMAEFASNDAQEALKLMDMARDEYRTLEQAGDKVNPLLIKGAKNKYESFQDELDKLDQEEPEVTKAQDLIAELWNKADQLMLTRVGARRSRRSR